jgi:hypothetical protein
MKPLQPGWQIKLVIVGFALLAGLQIFGWIHEGLLLGGRLP